MSKALSVVRKWASIVLVGALCIGAVACSDSVARPTRDDLVGAWKVDGDFGHEDLELRADGTYAQLILDERGHARENSGTWRYLAQGGPGASEPHVTLASALVARSQSDASPPREWQHEDWVLWTVTDWGALSLMWNPDVDSFKKR